MFAAKVVHPLPKKLNSRIVVIQSSTNTVYEGKSFHRCSADTHGLCCCLDSDRSTVRMSEMEDKCVNSLHCSVHRNSHLHTT